MLGAFDGHVNQKGLDNLKEKFKADPKVLAWFGTGLKEIGEWQTKLEADPNFDPNAEAPEPDEEEPTGDEA
jgi:hypothetical protein